MKWLFILTLRAFSHQRCAIFLFHLLLKCLLWAHMRVRARMSAMVVVIMPTNTIPWLNRWVLFYQTLDVIVHHSWRSWLQEFSLTFPNLRSQLLYLWGHLSRLTVINGPLRRIVPVASTPTQLWSASCTLISWLAVAIRIRSQRRSCPLLRYPEKLLWSLILKRKYSIRNFRFFLWHELLLWPASLLPIRSGQTKLLFLLIRLFAHILDRIKIKNVIFGLFFDFGVCVLTEVVGVVFVLVKRLRILTFIFDPKRISQIWIFVITDLLLLSNLLCVFLNFWLFLWVAVLQKWFQVLFDGDVFAVGKFEGVIFNHFYDVFLIFFTPVKYAINLLHQGLLVSVFKPSLDPNLSFLTQGFSLFFINFMFLASLKMDFDSSGLLRRNLILPKLV